MSRERRWHWPSNHYQSLPTQEPLIPLDEMIRRIEAARRLTPRPTTRRCLGPCGRMLPLTPEFFTKNRAQRGGGRRYVCRECDAARKRRARQQAKVSAYRAIPWRVGA